MSALGPSGVALCAALLCWQASGLPGAKLLRLFSCVLALFAVASMPAARAPARQAPEPVALASVNLSAWERPWTI